MLANGNSRRAAAGFAGCAPSTITRTVARDPEFAVQVARAERNAEVELFRSVRNACKEPRYWRTGAWCLERRNPEEFALRPPNTFTRRQVAELLVQAMGVAFEGLPDDKVDLALKHLDTLMQEIEETADGFPPQNKDAPTDASPSPLRGTTQELL